MLFGNDKIQDIVCNKAKGIASEIEGKIIFGAMVGSISQGVHAADSDYDTRFLYVRKDFPQNIISPAVCKEEDIVTRYYPPKGLFYDKIPLWEVSSFLQFIINPTIDGKFSVGLHHNIAWTFLSPYVWDPYGLVNKLTPMIYRTCNVKFELQYHVSKIEEFFQQDEDILVKNYLYAAIAASSIYYIERESTYAPIHIDSLMGLEEKDDIRQIVYGLIYKLREESKAYIQKADEFVLQGSHYNIKTKHNRRLDDYILEAYQLGERLVARQEERAVDKMIKDIVEQMYLVIERSMEEQIVNGLF